MKAALLAAYLMGGVSLSFAQQTPASRDTAAPPAVFGDGADAKFKRFDNMHGTRFIEIFLAGRDAKTKSLVANCYNTMFTLQRHSRIEGHRSASAGRGPQFRPDEEAIWRSRCILERRENLAARLE